MFPALATVVLSTLTAAALFYLPQFEHYHDHRRYLIALAFTIFVSPLYLAFFLTCAKFMPSLETGPVNVLLFAVFLIASALLVVWARPWEHNTWPRTLVMILVGWVAGTLSWICLLVAYISVDPEAMIQTVTTVHNVMP